MMPTKDQCQELIDNTLSGWITTGYKFISKVDTSKYIYLPAAGFWSNTNYDVVAEHGIYWLTTWYQSSTTHVWELYFYSGYLRISENPNRDYGFSIRAIAPPKPW